MFSHIALIEYTASEIGSTFSIALNATEYKFWLHNFQQEERKSDFAVKTWSVTQKKNNNINVFHPLYCIALEFQEAVKEKSQSDRLVHFTVNFLVSPKYRPFW